VLAKTNCGCGKGVGGGLSRRGLRNSECVNVEELGDEREVLGDFHEIEIAGGSRVEKSVPTKGDVRLAFENWLFWGFFSFISFRGEFVIVKDSRRGQWFPFRHLACAIEHWVTWKE